jgi:ABC-type multidrug transport system fused ATPase/permease subunit
MRQYVIRLQSIPLEALLMGINLGIYSNPEAYGGLHGVLLGSFLFVPLATLALFSKGLQQYGFGISGARLTQRLREMTFAHLVQLDMYYFDEPLHRPGAMVARLATDADVVKRVGGPLLGQLLTLVINSVLGLVIAFIYGWQLTLVMLGCAPILFGATFLERKALEGYRDNLCRFCPVLFRLGC